MEEQRISRMYVTLARQRVQAIWYKLTGSDGRGSGLLPVLAMLVVIAVPAGIYVAHRHAEFHRFEQKIQGIPPVEPGPRPGGRDPMVLTRKQSGGTDAPQFLSATLLPGLGMDVLQITAYLPGRGEVPLLVAPTLEQMADSAVQPLSGINDAHGALEVPWSGSLAGLPNPLGTAINGTWQGRAITVPTDAAMQPGMVEGGLLRLRDADTAEMKPAGDGAEASATYGATDFDDHWFSHTETSVRMQMEAASLVLTVRAKNVGDQPEPLGIGWHPRFAIPGGRRETVTLQLPASQRLEFGDKGRHLPTGKILALDAAGTGFVSHAAALGLLPLSEALVKMQAGGRDGAAAEMADAGARYGLRLTAESPAIRELRVVAPADQRYVSLGWQTNYDDPLGPEWAETEPITTLQPGESVEWKVRLEIFPAGRVGEAVAKVKNRSVAAHP